MFKIENLSVSFEQKPILNKVNLEVEENQWYMILGPNGVGKTTLVNAVAGQIDDYGGSIFFQGRNIKKMKPKEKARSAGFLTQHHEATYGYTVQEIVELGRYPYHKGMFYQEGAEDRQRVDYALETTGMQDFRQRPVTTLSGGELQRTYLAQLLVQNPQVMILDEPANHLDLSFEADFYRLIDDWRREEGRCVISIMHDLTVAKKYGDRALLLGRDNQVHEGRIDEVLSRARLQEVFDVDVVEMMRDRYELWTKKE